MPVLSKKVLVWFYGISTLVGYLIPNPFLFKESVLFKTIQFSMSIQFVPDIGLGVRVFANGPRDLGSIPGRVIPKTQKMVLDTSLLNTQHYKVRIKGKVEQSREGVAPSPTHWCSSYRKGSLRVTLDYGRQLYLLIQFVKNFYFKLFSLFKQLYIEIQPSVSTASMPKTVQFQVQFKFKYSSIVKDISTLSHSVQSSSSNSVNLV